MSKIKFVRTILISLLLGVIITTAFPVNVQAMSFDAAVNYAVGTNPTSVTAGDFNRDGNPDLAVANSDSDNVSVLIGNGDGTFGGRVDYTVGTWPVSVAAGDFNRDGKTDLAVANAMSNNISILTGNGDGTFIAAANYTVGSVPYSVTAGDFNRDGKPDLAVANNDSDNVSILTGNGDGTFGGRVDYGLGIPFPYPRSVTAGDFNRDGKPDLAVANWSSNNVSILTGKGDGTFNAAVNYTVGANPGSVTAGDFNRDGKPDLAVANKNSANVSVLLNTSPEIDVEYSGTSIADGDSTPSTADGTDFGNADISTGTVDRTFTITNSGDAVLNLTGTPVVAVGGTDAGDFAVTAQPSTPIASSGGTTTFTVRFDPSAVGARTATISIANNDSNENPYDFAIQGTGVTPEMNLKEGMTNIPDGGSYGFGSHLVNTDTDVTFTIENTGTGDLTLTTPLTIAAGVNADQFSIQTQPVSPVTASGNTTFVVRFTPTSVGAKTANISIANNDDDENPYDLTLTGTGIAPGITSASPSSGYPGNSFSVTINGTNLSGATTVNFGSGITTNSFTVGSSTQITATIDISGSAVPGTRDISVTTPGGTATLVGGFSVLEVVTYDEPSYYLKINLLGTSQSFSTSHSGKVRQTVEITSTDGLLTVTIPKGTVARQENGHRLTTLGVSENDNPPLPPENKNIIGLTYNFEPDGATFDPPITLTFTYDPETLPEGVEEEDLVLAFYDEDTGSWIELECVVDTDNHTITALVSHFTNFAIIGKVIPPAAFIVSNLTVEPEQIAPGEVVIITVSIANTDGMEGSYTAILEVNGVREETQSISIAAGGTKRVDFTVSREEPGDYVVKVGALEGNFTVTVPPAPAAFSVSGLSVLPAEVELGETITVSMVVANTGGEAGSYTAVLKINGGKEEEKTVTIAAGSSQTVSFRVTREEAGSCTVTVDGLSGSFTVVAPPAPSRINWALIGGIIGGGGVVVGLLIFFLVIRRRAY